MLSISHTEQPHSRDKFLAHLRLTLEHEETSLSATGTFVSLGYRL
jgi:hypothetical protein